MNLYHALQKLRSFNRQTPSLNGAVMQKKTHIWIDAICINQYNLDEQIAPVAMMENIYKGAQLVICWLGKEDRYTGPALHLINHLARIPKEQYNLHRSLGSARPGTSQKDWEALVAFFRRPYFRRAWIVQELILAPCVIVFCGSYEISWKAHLQCSLYLKKQKHTDILMFFPLNL